MATEKKEEKEEVLTPEKRETKKSAIKGEGNLFVGGKKLPGEKGKERYEFKKYELTYDSFGESLEPVYYWILDFMRDIGYGVEKTADFFAAAEASGWLGEMGQRRTALEKRASEILGTLNLVIKSIINLVYDLREFDLRFKSYDALKAKEVSDRKSGEQSLKTIWLTEVDMKKGAAAINMMVQNLNFISLRDAFMAAEVKWGKDRSETRKKTLEFAEKIDVPDIVKRPLIGRVGEFVEWVYASETELRKRYNIEKAYLKSQVSAMQVYTKWARPYLIATQRLMPAEVETFGKEYESFGITAAELASPFDVMHTYLEIFGKKEIRNYGTHLPEIKITNDDEKIYACVEIKLGFRASPGGAGERGHYTAKGKVVAQFIPYVLTGKQLVDLKKLQDREVLQFIDVMTQETLEAMKEEIDEYVKEKKEEKKEEKKKFELPLVKHIKWTVEQINKFKEASKKLGIKLPPKKQLWEIELLKVAAAKKAAKDAQTIYETYKKSHGMLAW